MLENFRDYNLYLFKIKRGEIIILLIDLILFSISTYTLITNWRDLFSLDSNEKGVLLVLIGTIIKFIYDSYNIIKECYFRFGKNRISKVIEKNLLTLINYEKGLIK